MLARIATCPVYFAESGLRPRLVAVADTVPARVDLAVENFGFASGTLDWRELMARDDIDVIDITAPNAYHREMAEAAAAAGKHIACEKPVGIHPRRDGRHGARRPRRRCHHRLWLQLPLGAARAVHPPAHRGRAPRGADALSRSLLLDVRARPARPAVVAIPPGGGRLWRPERPDVPRHRHGPVPRRTDRPRRRGQGDVRQGASRCPSPAVPRTMPVARPATRPAR